VFFPLRRSGALCMVLAGAIGAAHPARAAEPQAAPPPSADGAEPFHLGAGPDEALSPAAARFRDGLALALVRAPGAEAAAITAFYAGRDFRPYWSEGGRAETLMQAVARAGEHGLPAARYQPGQPAPIDAEADPIEAARTEAATTRAYLLFARDLTSGMLDPSEIDEEINVRPERPAPGELLERLDEAASLETALDGLAPATPEYAALMAERQRLETLAAAGGWGDTVPDGPSLHQNDTSPRVPALRTRLARLGYETGAAADELRDANRFDAELHAAVQRFQREHGLLDDGVAGRRTLAAINASVETRLQQVLVNLERLRWRQDPRTGRFIHVNIPDYSATMFEDGEEVYASRVVVGEASKTRTPEFSDEMTHMVVNPTWYIPDSIAKRVFLPKLRADPNYLANNDIRILTRGGTEISPALVDFSQLASGRFPFRIQQRPSTANALGRVKFMFPNQFSIYLHDTPARELFERDARTFSNGCIRLEEPFELAYLLLAPQIEDPEAAFDAWVDAGKERYVYLDDPVQVHIDYRTVWADPSGEVHYRDDVYGRDAKLFRALGAQGVRLAQG
jgi:L,D-transpeptidase YcbB